LVDGVTENGTRNLGVGQEELETVMAVGSPTSVDLLGVEERIDRLAREDRGADLSSILRQIRGGFTAVPRRVADRPLEQFALSLTRGDQPLSSSCHIPVASAVQRASRERDVRFTVGAACGRRRVCPPFVRGAFDFTLPLAGSGGRPTPACRASIRPAPQRAGQP
jgi:hypothetical protein